MKRLQNLLLLYLFVFVYSCKKNDVKNEGPEQTQTNEVLRRILDLGFREKDIVEYPDRYVVQGDIAFLKNDPGLNSGIKTKQTRSNNTVAVNNTLIRVFVNNNFPTLFNNIVTALDDAIIGLNSIGSELFFVRTTNQNEANITITMDNGIRWHPELQREIELCGLGGFPFSDGRPFNQIRISEQTLHGNGITSHWQLVFLLSHELGHNIGLRHTNWAVADAPSSAGAVHIPGTPTSDPNSVMNTPTCGLGWNNWSTHDRTAILTMYPKLPSGHQLLGNASWAGTEAMTSLNGWIYNISNSFLHKVNPADGSYTVLGGQDWGGTEAMTTLNGWLYIVQNNLLHRVNPNDGSYVVVGNGNWGGTQAMTSINGWLYIIQNNILYRTDPNTGIWTNLGGAVWADTDGMTTLNGYIYIAGNNAMHKVNPADGTYVIVGGVNFGGTDAITTAANGWMYAIVHNRIYRVDGNGSYNQFGGSVWEDSDAVTSIGNELFIVSNTLLYKLAL
jgi:hypothetical protein